MEAHPETDLCGTQVRLFAEGGLSEGYQTYERWVNGVLSPADIKRERMVECPLPHPTWMGRRELFEDLQGYVDDSLPEDYHFILRCALMGRGGKGSVGASVDSRAELARIRNEFTRFRTCRSG